MYNNIHRLILLSLQCAKDHLFLVVYSDFHTSINFVDGNRIYEWEWSHYSTGAGVFRNEYHGDFFLPPGARAFACDFDKSQFKHPQYDVVRPTDLTQTGISLASRLTLRHRTTPSQVTTAERFAITCSLPSAV